MGARLDELFSPDRLRLNWQSPEPPQPPPLAGPNQEIHNQWQQVRQSLSQRFGDHAVLAVLLDGIEAQIIQAYPPSEAGGAVDPPTQADLLIQLEALEETVWALELSQTGRGGE